VDIVGLKKLNDSVGPGAGDELLRHVAMLIRSHLRPYDLIVRFADDEFVCAVPGMSEAHVRERFSAIGSALADHGDARGIRTGFSTLRDDDDSADLIYRADGELIQPSRQ